jgi:putative ABC transport system permease protein
MREQDEMARSNWNLFDVDYGFIEAMGLELVAGRSFSADMGGDARDAVLLNEAAARAASELMGAPWEQPLGRQVDRYVQTATDWVFARPGRVIGVIRDFHYQSLHHPIAPMVLHLGRVRRDNIIVRLRPGDPTAALAHAEAVWRDFLPERPFEYYFLDAAFDEQYRVERRVSLLMGVFTALSLVVAALGLFGLAAFTAERRTREVGIRKVLGASTSGLVLLLAGSFTRLVLLAFVLVAPLAYLLMDRWLSSFAYRTGIAWWIFAVTALAALALSWLTVGYQSFRVASSDPVDVLRYE